ncbi:MAG: hypothetical protein LBS35_00875 [Synergistaceae bacterium]|jgi:processive 1,2-diacylglycerol beta-glucosyltransferase|nr:hypothetical protein [Synergistaceae bacterium]
MNSILIAHSSAGNGHRAVANTIKNTLESFIEETGNRGATNVILADSLSFGGALFRAFYTKGYEWTAQRMRWLISAIYTLTDKSMDESRLTRLIEKGVAESVKGLAGFIEANDIGVICCTHFLPMSLLADMKRKGQFSGRLHVCVTDYQAHGFWADPDVDQYYVATAAAAERLAGWGIKPSRIRITGIPVSEKFSQITPSRWIRGSELNILFSASSLKKRECFRVLDEMSDTNIPMNVTLVAGRTESLVNALSGHKTAAGKNLRIKGYVNNMAEIMASSDIIITKPGGVTCSEALCANLPMLFVAPIPKQEILNARIISHQGAGVICFRRGGVSSALRYLDGDRDRIRIMRQKCGEFAKPMAAQEIGAHLLDTSCGVAL